ncbi:response regulator [Phormidium tenue FACHB-886]|nr:response regulator [Phormidium tenue FACHB-886]
MLLNLAPVLIDLQVLVVDSDVDSCELLRFALEQYALTVRTAVSVPQALHLFATFQPDILITTLWLPEQDGYTLLSKIRRLEPVRGGKALALAVTADTTQPLQQAIAAGFVKVLLKPIDVEKLAAMLAELVRQEGFLPTVCLHGF